MELLTETPAPPATPAVSGAEGLSFSPESQGITEAERQRLKSADSRAAFHAVGGDPAYANLVGQYVESLLEVIDRGLGDPPLVVVVDAETRKPRPGPRGLMSAAELVREMKNTAAFSRLFSDRPRPRLVLHQGTWRLI